MHVQKTRTTYIRSSKHAGALAGRALTAYLLHCIQNTLTPNLSPAHSTKQVSRKFADLQSHGYLTKKGVSYRLTSIGLDVLNEKKIWELTIPTPKHWDGKWHMVLYDIPTKKNRQRNSFRARLKELGLILYQNSVWVHPYPLEATISQISDFYKISDCVLLAVAEKLHGELKLKRAFKL